jgi:hypothetical protein
MSVLLYAGRLDAAALLAGQANCNPFAWAEGQVGREERARACGRGVSGDARAERAQRRKQQKRVLRSSPSVS